MYRLYFPERPDPGLLQDRFSHFPLFTFRYLRSAFRYPCSAFHFPLSAFRFLHFTLPSRIPLSIQPQSQPHFHLFTFLSSLRLLLLEADSSVLPETLDEPRSLFPLSPPFFRFVLLRTRILYKELGTRY